MRSHLTGRLRSRRSAGRGQHFEPSQASKIARKDDSGEESLRRPLDSVLLARKKRSPQTLHRSTPAASAGNRLSCHPRLAMPYAGKYSIQHMRLCPSWCGTRCCQVDSLEQASPHLASKTCSASSPSCSEENCHSRPSQRSTV